MKILLAVDGSRHSDAAVLEARSRPWPEGSVVRVFSAVRDVLPPLPASAWGTVSAPGPTLGSEDPEVIERLRKETAARLQHIASALKSAGLNAEVSIGKGDPRSAIVDEAEKWGADLILVGSRGLTGIRRWLLGSVAQAVVVHAPCSVEVVRSRE